MGLHYKRVYIGVSLSDFLLMCFFGLQCRDSKLIPGAPSCRREQQRREPSRPCSQGSSYSNSPATSGAWGFLGFLGSVAITHSASTEDVQESNLDVPDHCAKHPAIQADMKLTQRSGKSGLLWNEGAKIKLRHLCTALLAASHD